MTELTYINIFSYFDLLQTELYCCQISLENNNFFATRPPFQSHKSSILVELNANSEGLQSLSAISLVITNRSTKTKQKTSR